MSDNIKHTLKEFILETFLPGEAASKLTDSTPLITDGVLDSIATLKLVMFLAETYKVSFDAHEVDVEHMNTISDIERLVRSKMG